MQKPKLSYSRLDEKPLLHNQAAIEAAVEYLNKHDAYYYQGLPDFEVDDKFKDYYIEKYEKEPTQEDIQEYVKELIMECKQEEEKRVKELEESNADKQRVTISQGKEFNSKKSKKNS